MNELQALIEKLGVHEALGPTGEGYGIEQNPEELATFLFKNVDPSDEWSVLEIGTGRNAGLARLLGEVLQLKVTTIDPENDPHREENVLYLWSKERISFEDQFDVVIIDGDNSRDAIEQDYIHYGAYASKVIAICKIAGLRGCEGVAQFWKEIAYTKAGKLKKNFHEAIAEDDKRSGIGWIVK